MTLNRPPENAQGHINFEIIFSYRSGRLARLYWAAAVVGDEGGKISDMGGLEERLELLLLGTRVECIGILGSI